MSNSSQQSHAKDLPTSPSVHRVYDTNDWHSNTETLKALQGDFEQFKTSVSQASEETAAGDESASSDGGVVEVTEGQNDDLNSLAARVSALSAEIEENRQTWIVRRDRYSEVEKGEKEPKGWNGTKLSSRAREIALDSATVLRGHADTQVWGLMDIQAKCDKLKSEMAGLVSSVTVSI